MTPDRTSRVTGRSVTSSSESVAAPSSAPVRREIGLKHGAGAAGSGNLFGLLEVFIEEWRSSTSSRRRRTSMARST